MRVKAQTKRSMAGAAAKRSVSREGGVIELCSLLLIRAPTFARCTGTFRLHLRSILAGCAPTGLSHHHANAACAHTRRAGGRVAAASEWTCDLIRTPCLEIRVKYLRLALRKRWGAPGPLRRKICENSRAARPPQISQKKLRNSRTGQKKRSMRLRCGRKRKR